MEERERREGRGWGGVSEEVASGGREGKEGVELRGM